jgi:hypothetical protein
MPHTEDVFNREDHIHSQRIVSSPDKMVSEWEG